MPHVWVSSEFKVDEIKIIFPAHLENINVFDFLKLIVTSW